MPSFLQSKIRSLYKLVPYLICFGLFVFVIVESFKLHFLLQDLRPDQFLRNKTVVEQWRKVVVGGPWDIKHMMAGPICVFVLGPLASVTMDIFPLANFPFITANLVTCIHVAFSIASFRLLLSPKLCRRRIGASFFFLRQYFDELDGKVAHFWMDRNLHTPGRLGFWIDGLSDTVSVIILVVSLFLLNHRSHDNGNNNNNNNNHNDYNHKSSPPSPCSSPKYDDYRRLEDGVVVENGVGATVKSRRPCRSCGDGGVVVVTGGVAEDDIDDSFSSCSSASREEGPLMSHSTTTTTRVNGVVHCDDNDDDSGSGSDDSLLLITNACKKIGRTSPTSTLQLSLFPASSSSPSSPSSSSSSPLSFSSFVCSRLLHRKTAMIVGFVATLSLSCAIWNNACYIYMDLLDTEPECPRKRETQLRILKSWMSFVVFHGWRVCMPLAIILQCAIAIFVDKTLWFASFCTRVYFWYVVAISILTVAHLSEIRDVLNDSQLCS